MRKKSKPNKGKAAKKSSAKAKKPEYRPAKFDASKCSTPPASSLSTTGFYNPKIVDHFSNPHNYGKMENPDAIGRAGNPICGDVMEIWLKMNGDRIQQATFSTTGCGPTVAALSFITELARGKSIAEIKRITPEYVLNALGDLPEENIECAVLAVQILKEAIKDYLAFKNEPWKRMYRQQRY